MSDHLSNPEQPDRHEKHWRDASKLEYAGLLRENADLREENGRLLARLDAQQQPKDNMNETASSPLMCGNGAHFFSNGAATCACQKRTRKPSFEQQAEELRKERDTLLARLDAQQQAHHAEMNRLLAGFTEERAARQREFDEQFDRRQVMQQRLDAVTALARQIIEEFDRWNRAVEQVIGRQANQWPALEDLRAAVLTGEARP